MAAPRRRKMIGHRRRIEDEGDDEGRQDALDLDDDSLSEGSIVTDDHDPADDSDTSNIDEASPTSPNPRMSTNGAAKSAKTQPPKRAPDVASNNQVSDTDMMLHGLSIVDHSTPAQEMHFDEIVVSPPESAPAPVIVRSGSIDPQATDEQPNRRRQEHEDYKRRRDEDPAFVPNRGSFFMHDHRHPGPAANGFRPFGRGRGRGGSRGGIGGPFSPMNHMHRPSDPTTNNQWTHDMHDAVANPPPRRPRHMAPAAEGPPNGNGVIPTCQPSSSLINRTLSTEKHIANVHVRVFLPTMHDPKVFPGMAVKQYTKLPNHRPPLRSDRPVRISLPNNPPRYIFPASDRSFTFIPRELRPNQRMRGKPRSAWGSVSGFSRRTSIFGGSYYNGSMYSPSIALSRRSSIVHDRDYMFSPTGSMVSRAHVPVESARPVVRLPPAARADVPATATVGPMARLEQTVLGTGIEPSINDLPQPQTHPLPQKPAFQENRPTSLPIHQPRPQKNISVADIEAPSLSQGPQAFQQAFHQQVPVHVAGGYNHDAHARRPSYPSQHSAGTPLSHIPERAIHAAPFQPHPYGQQQSFYNQQHYPTQAQQGYYYPPAYSGPNLAASALAPAYAPPGQHSLHGGFPPQNQPQNAPDVAAGAAPSSNPNLVAQEVNGMVYYYDATQMPPVNTYPSYSAPQSFQPNVMGMGGMVTPSPDGFYYQQPTPGMVYYSQ